MVHSAQVPTNVANSPKAQQLISQLHEIRVKVVPGSAIVGTGKNLACEDYSSSGNPTAACALADSFVMGVKCSMQKKYLTLEAELGAFHAVLGLDTVKVLLKD
ncbi:hypothetical protein L208DRAFT_1383011 [Tricholoma matsutake]|nr:hypothetical protein L208DRAFT_1383011 [Tricholoma matsutake 945]